MRYDRDMRYRRRGMARGRGEYLGRGEYGAIYEAPYRAGFHGFGMGYAGGALRSRGSYEAGQIRSGLTPHDEFEFEWGDGYVGGRGYGGTNYDLEHGYRVGAIRRPDLESAQGHTVPPPPRPQTSVATRGGYEWGEYGHEYVPTWGPARYGYGPYHERLRRRRRSDEEIKQDVEDALFYDTWVDAERILVEVEDGVVTLRGILPNYEEIRYATDDAWDVDGVRGVRSELTVMGESPETTEEQGETPERMEAAERATEEEGGTRKRSRSGRTSAMASGGSKSTSRESRSKS